MQGFQFPIFMRSAFYRVRHVNFHALILNNYCSDNAKIGKELYVRVIFVPASFDYLKGSLLRVKFGVMLKPFLS